LDRVFAKFLSLNGNFDWDSEERKVLSVDQYEHPDVSAAVYSNGTGTGTSKNIFAIIKRQNYELGSTAKHDVARSIGISRIISRM
jgi:hypothetical protein